MDPKEFQDRRKHLRFSSSAFYGVSVHLKPLPPFFGKPLVGSVFDLSAGGMALQIDKKIPMGTKLHLELTFPDRAVLNSTVNICYAASAMNKFLIGVEFLDLPKVMGVKIQKMAEDFMHCEERIKFREKEICKSDCSFFHICDKPEKKSLVKKVESKLHIKFKKI